MEENKGPAFRAKARYYDNRNGKKKDKDPDWKVYVNFRPEDARAAANWLLEMADWCQMGDGSTFRQYKPDGSFEEVVGFSTGIGMWEQAPREGDKLDEDGLPLYPRFSGWWRPFMPEMPQQQPEPETSGESETPNVTTETCPMQPQDQEQCPMPDPTPQAEKEEQPKEVAAVGW